MIYTNKYNCPEWVMKYAQAGEDRRRKEGRFGVYELIAGPMVRHLLMTKWDEIKIDVSEYLNMALGNGLHELADRTLKASDSKSIAEEKIEIDVAGITVVGVHDLYTPSEERIDDYKTSKVISPEFGLKDDYIEALNMYAWQRRQLKQPISKLGLKYFFKDFMPTKAMYAKKDSYPRAGFMDVDVPVWDASVAEKFVAARLLRHSKPDSPCNDKETWRSVPKYAVCNNALKQPCKKLCDSQLEAEEYIKFKFKPAMQSKMTVEFRKSESIKCKFFCTCRSVCPHAPKNVFVA